MKTVRKPGEQGTRNRRTWTKLRRITMGVALAITAISIAGYVVLSLLANNPSPTMESGSLGWAALIQPATESQADTVTLQASFSGNNRFTYTVHACGPDPYHGRLIMSGLSGDPESYSEFDGPSQEEKLSTRQLEFDISYRSTATAHWEEYLGTVQSVSVDVPYVIPCVPDQFAPQIQVSGTLEGPWMETSSLFDGFLQGPHASLSFPLVGEFWESVNGGVQSPLASRPFTVSGLAGTWTHPDHQQVLIEPDISPDWSVNSAAPTQSPWSTVPFWTSTNGISPIATLSDPSQVAAIQAWIVILAVGFGIGGSLLASLLFEILRPPREHHEAVVRHGEPSTPEQQSPPLKQSRAPMAILSGLAALLLLGYLRQRRSKRTGQPRPTT